MKSPPDLLGALFSPVERRVFGLIFGQPRRRFQSAELIRLVQGGIGSVHRILIRLEEVELVNVTWVGNQKFYQANDGCRIYPELCSMVAKTTGLVEPLAHALRPFARDIVAAFVYGPVGKKLQISGSEIELVVLSDGLDVRKLVSTLAPLEKTVGHPVPPVVFTPYEWGAKFDAPGSIIGRITRQPRLFVIGTEADIRVIEVRRTR